MQYVKCFKAFKIMQKGVCVPWNSSYVLLSVYRKDVCFMDGVLITCVPVTNVCVNYICMWLYETYKDA
jgi:hypothetical protein